MQGLVGRRAILDYIKFVAPNGTPYTLYCVKEMIKYTGKSITPTGTIFGTDNIRMSSGIEIKSAKLGIEVLNTVANRVAADVINLLPLISRIQGGGTYDDGTPFVMTALNVIRMTVLELDFGIGGGTQTTLELDCGSVTFVE